MTTTPRQRLLNDEKALREANKAKLDKAVEGLKALEEMLKNTRREKHISAIKALYGLSDTGTLLAIIRELGYDALSDQAIAQLATAQDRYEQRITSFLPEDEYDF